MRYNVKQPYSETRFVPVRLRGLIDLLRPFTLIAPFFGVVFGVLAATGYENLDFDSVNWFNVVYAGVTMMLINGASNALNQAADVDADSVSKPYRPIPQGIITPEEARTVAYVLYAFALFRAAAISEWFALVCFIIVLFTIAYNTEPIRFKRRGWWANVAIAIPRGLLGFVAAWSVVADPIYAMPWVLGAVMMWYLIGGQNTKDYVDVIGDKAAGFITPVIKYGPKKLTFLSLPFLLPPGVAIMYLGTNGYIPNIAIWFGAATFVLTWWTATFMLDHRYQDFKRMENSPSWACMYVTLLIMMLGFGLMYWM